MNNFSLEPEALVESELAAVEKVIRSAHWILGKEVQAFEESWEEVCKIEHCIGVASGMDALQIGLMALGIGQGDEVITTPVTAFATVLAILRIGAVPVLADIEPNNAMLSLDSVDRCISDKTRAVLLVHLYGQIGPVKALKNLCDEKGLYLVEDCAQAHGAEINDMSAGQFGDVAAWSFYPTKNLGAIGDAGALTCHDESLAERARSLRNYGQVRRYYHEYSGLNSRLDEIQAAILLARLAYLPSWLKARRSVAQQYFDGIRSNSIVPMQAPESIRSHAFHLFVVLCDDRSDLEKYLKSCGIECLIHYPVPVHQQMPTKELGRDPQGLANAERHCDNCLSIPCHPYLKPQEVETTIHALNQYGNT